MRTSTIRTAALCLLAACGGKPPAPPPAPVIPQLTEAVIREAGELITEANTRERLTIISHDSMGGRNTPSPGLEKVAQYLADNYARWGLKPAGENGSYFQRYSVALTGVNVNDSYLELREAGRVSRYRFDKFATVSNVPTAQAVSAPVKILLGQ